MSERISNWQLLARRGTTMESSHTGGRVNLTTPNLHLALHIAFELTIELDTLAPHERFMHERDTFPFQDHEKYALEQFRSNSRSLYGPERPAEANTGVRVENHDDTFKLVAQLYNDFEEQPEVYGKGMLQPLFTQVIESLDLP